MLWNFETHSLSALRLRKTSWRKNLSPRQALVTGSLSCTPVIGILWSVLTFTKCGRTFRSGWHLPPQSVSPGQGRRPWRVSRNREKKATAYRFFIILIILFFFNLALPSWNVSFLIINFVYTQFLSSFNLSFPLNLSDYWAYVSLVIK